MNSQNRLRNEDHVEFHAGSMDMRRVVLALYEVIFIFGSVGTPRNALTISSGGSSHEPRGIPRFPLVFLTNYLRNFHVIRQR